MQEGGGATDECLWTFSLDAISLCLCIKAYVLECLSMVFLFSILLQIALKDVSLECLIMMFILNVYVSGYFNNDVSLECLSTMFLFSKVMYQAIQFLSSLF